MECFSFLTYRHIEICYGTEWQTIKIFGYKKGEKWREKKKNQCSKWVCINYSNDDFATSRKTTFLFCWTFFLFLFFFLKKTEKKNDVLNGHYHTDVTICNNADKRAWKHHFLSIIWEKEKQSISRRADITPRSPLRLGG